MIHYLFPYSTTKNIGGAYNEAIRNLKADKGDWIVIKDWDASFLTPDAGRQVAEVARTTDYDLLGCMTGRLAGTDQLLNGIFDNKVNMFKNLEDAQRIETELWGVVSSIPTVAGMFMMFRWSTWFNAGGFNENTYLADIEFNRAVMAMGGKIGVMKGLYCFHAYRLWEPMHMRAAKSFGHLRQNA